MVLAILFMSAVDAWGEAAPSDSVTSISAPACPPARGVGTISPAIAIFSMTLIVNGVERTVRGDDTLQAHPGDEVQVREVVICAGAYSGDGGKVCVDISPTGQDGRAIFSEHKGTHMMPVIPGVTRISGLDFAWTVGAGWKNLAAVVNHWTPERTADLECAGGLCERDDRIMIEFR
jgi:hypothetical protein